MLNFFNVEYSDLAKSAYDMRNHEMDIKNHTFSWLYKMPNSKISLVQKSCENAMKLYGYSSSEYPLLNKPIGYM